MNMIEPGSPRWAELVQQGILRDAGRNWFLGDAALEIAPMEANGGDRSSPNQVGVNLERYADEIGLAVGSLRIYRDVASKWLPATRVPGTSWKVHQMLASRPELIREGMTVTQAHAAMGQSTNGRTGPNSSPEARARQTLDNLSDPDVVSRITQKDIQDAQLKAIQAGGIVRHPSEVERERRANNPLRAVEEMAREQRDPVANFCRAVDLLILAGPFPSDSAEAETIRSNALRALDAVASEARA